MAVTSVFNVYAPCFSAGCIGDLIHADATATGFYDPVAMTWGVSSTTTFPFGLTWTASGGTLYAPGTYTVNVNGDGADQSVDNGANAGSLVTFTVPTGHIGGNINFASGATSGIDMFLLWDSTGASVDMNDDDGSPGMAMVDGPFPGYNASFNLSAQPTVVPVPAAVWLFGSGLLGLAGLARRKKKN